MRDARIRLLAQIAISLAMLGVGAYVFVVSDDPDKIAAAAGWSGIVVGYWLK